jgi:dTDP-4-amino-4,6-dideoxygalactose transaminase
MPSYTFVSTANAFVLRGGIPVFVDVRSDTFNLDETKIEAAITPRTKAIVPVHYAGVGCEMDTIMDIANRHDLLVIEDAAQGIGATYKGRPLGNAGHMAALSFHQTKNATCGEGGALLLNDSRWTKRAEIIWEKGTNRNQFFRGQADKYTWVEVGSSYLPSELTAAFLFAQLEQLETITRDRLNIWMQYHQAFTDLEDWGQARRPVVPDECQHNAHMYYLLLPSQKQRQVLLESLKAVGIHAVFHYVPLHTSPAGRKYGRAYGDLSQTQRAGNCLVRLPLWVGMTTKDIQRIARTVCHTLKG